METRQVRGPRSGPAPHKRAAWWAVRGAAGGFVGGAAIAVYEMVVVADVFGMNAFLLIFLLPLRALGIAAAEQPAATNGYPALAYQSTAFAGHMLISGLLGLCLGLALAALPATAPGALARPVRAAATGAAYGLLLWLLGPALLVPAAGSAAFTHPMPAAQLLGYTAFFGVPLTLYLHYALA